MRRTRQNIFLGPIYVWRVRRTGIVTAYFRAIVLHGLLGILSYKECGANSDRVRKEACFAAEYM